MFFFLFQLLNSSFPIGSFFIYSDYVLKISVCIFILFSNSVDILIINALNSLSGKLFISVLLFFSRGFLLLFQLRAVPLLFRFA